MKNALTLLFCLFTLVTFGQTELKTNTLVVRDGEKDEFVDMNYDVISTVDTVTFNSNIEGASFLVVKTKVLKVVNDTKGTIIQYDTKTSSDLIVFYNEDDEIIMFGILQKNGVIFYYYFEQKNAISVKELRT